MFIAILLEISAVWILGLFLVVNWFFSTSFWDKVQRNVPEGLQLVFYISCIVSCIFVVGSYFVSEMEFQSNVKAWGFIFGCYIVLTIAGYSIKYIMQVRETIRRTKGLD